MEKKKSNLIMLIAVLIIVVFSVGIAYAALSFRGESANQQLVLGDIYMHYNEINQGIVLENALPEATYDSTKYFEFTISGKNTYTKKDIWYDINLMHGNVPDDATRTIRIKDDLLKFRLVEVVDNVENEIFTNKSFSDLSNKRVHVNRISSSDNDYSKIYRLYMWISNDVKLCSGDSFSNCDYYLDGRDETLDWNKVFASIRVNVTGDLNEKQLEETTDESCFTTYQPIKSYQMLDASACASYLASLDYCSAKDPENCDAERLAFCDGTGTFAGKTFEKVIFNNYFEDEIVDYMINNNIISVSYEDYITISGYNSSCPKDIIIPEQINNLNVEKIDIKRWTKLTSSWFVVAASNEGGALAHLNLNSVVLPNTLRIIGPGSFFNNNLTTIEIPDSVEDISEYAFDRNQLETVEIGSGIQYIGEAAFYKSTTENHNLSSITINKSCSDIKNIQGNSDDTTIYYPWLSNNSPYTASGVTIYGSNNEVCDVF